MAATGGSIVNISDGIRVNIIAPGTTMTDMMTTWQQRDPSPLPRESAMR